MINLFPLGVVVKFTYATRISGERRTRFCRALGRPRLSFTIARAPTEEGDYFRTKNPSSNQAVRSEGVRNAFVAKENTVWLSVANCERNFLPELSRTTCSTLVSCRGVAWRDRSPRRDRADRWRSCRSSPTDTCSRADSACSRARRRDGTSWRVRPSSSTAEPGRPSCLYATTSTVTNRSSASCDLAAATYIQQN